MIRHSYWSLVILVGFLNLFCINCDIVSLIPSPVPVRYTKVTLCIIILLLEPPVAWHAAKHITVPVNMKVFNVLCCCCLCSCGRCSIRRWRPRLVHTLSLCHILWFVHRLASGSIMSVILIVNNPPQMLTLIAFFILAFLCAFLMLYSAITICGNSNRCNIKTFIYVVFCFFMGITTIILLALFSQLYLVFLEHGLNYSTVGGFVLSVIPPAVIFVLGVYIKTRLTLTKRSSRIPPEQDNTHSIQVDQDNIPRDPPDPSHVI